MKAHWQREKDTISQIREIKQKIEEANMKSRRPSARATWARG